MNAAHVFATGIAVDAMLHHRPSKPKFHQVDLSRYYSNNSANSNNTVSTVPFAPYSPPATAPVLSKLISTLKQKGYIDRDVEYVTSNRGVTNIRRNSPVNSPNFVINEGYHSGMEHSNSNNEN
jgi:hypothetical protein